MTRNLTENSYENIFIGTKFSLDCPFRHFDRIQWFKNGINISDQDGSLEFMNITMKDNGTYFCHVSNAAGSRHYEHSIIVHFPPKAELKINNKTYNEPSLDVIISESFHMECGAIGCPDPQVCFTFNYNNLADLHTIIISFNDVRSNGSIMVISSPYTMF